MQTVISICLPPSPDVEPGGGAELVLAVLGPRRSTEALQLPEVVGRARPRVTAAPYSADPSLVNSSSYSVSQNSGSAVVEWRRCCCAAALCSPMLARRGLDTSTKYLQ